MSGPNNAEIAATLDEVAELLELQQANPFRVSAWRRAAQTVRGLEREVADIAAGEGLDGLIALPNIGRGIAAALTGIAATGRWSGLDRLRGELDPVRLFQTVPGIGPRLAERIHDTLHLDTLEGLESAAHDGRLATVPGMGGRRVQAVRAALDAVLGRLRGRRGPPAAGPPAAVLLDVDREYRGRAAAGELPRIAPRRFNPEHRAWLPLLHAQRGGWHFTAMFSNTARAHELGRTGDWVVIYFYDDEHREGQRTVVTESRGPLAGRRVVRGMERECREHYAVR